MQKYLNQYIYIYIYIYIYLLNRYVFSIVNNVNLR